MSARRDWQPQLDAEIIEAAGRYDALSRLSDAHRIGVNVLLARWHQLRVLPGNAPKRRRAPLPPGRRVG